MLKQASVSDLISERVTRDKAYVVITMRRYPRFVSRKYRDEYVSCMSPAIKLHEDWLTAKRRYQDHDGAFARSRFEERFGFGEDGMRELERLVARSKQQDVYFVCQCQDGRRCHRELVLILAKALFGAKIPKLSNEYATFRKRIPEFKKALRAAQVAAKSEAPLSAPSSSRGGQRKYTRPKSPKAPAPARAARPRRSPRPAAAKPPRA